MATRAWIDTTRKVWKSKLSDCCPARHVQDQADWRYVDCDNFPLREG